MEQKNLYPYATTTCSSTVLHAQNTYSKTNHYYNQHASYLTNKGIAYLHKLYLRTINFWYWDIIMSQLIVTSSPLWTRKLIMLTRVIDLFQIVYIAIRWLLWKWWTTYHNGIQSVCNILWCLSDCLHIEPLYVEPEKAKIPNGLSTKYQTIVTKYIMLYVSLPRQEYAMVTEIMIILHKINDISTTSTTYG